MQLHASSNTSHLTMMLGCPPTFTTYAVYLLWRVARLCYLPAYSQRTLCPHILSSWSAISRRDRYRKRCAGAGDEPVCTGDDDNVLPGMIDPITLEPVVTPAISPYGHVMGLATWRAVLVEQPRCPFTKQPLRPEQLVVLNANNISKHRDRIVTLA